MTALAVSRPWRVPSLTEVHAQVLTGSLLAYVQEAWPHVQSGRPLKMNRAVEALCLHLQALDERRIRNLLIEMPFRFGKSTIISVIYPTWVWARRATERFLCSSYSAKLALRDADKARVLIRSAWYQQHFGSRFRLRAGQDAKEFYETDHGGYRVSLGVGGGTGWGGDQKLCDDPHNADDALSEPIRTGTIEWHDGSWSSRNEDHSTAVSCVSGQRTHLKDLIGTLKGRGGCEVLHLPNRYQPATRHPPTVIGWSDNRTVEGELLAPAVCDDNTDAYFRRTLGSYRSSAQLDQNPVPLEGNLFPRDKWRYFTVRQARFDFVLSMWDCNFKETAKGSYVCGGMWGRIGADCYLLDVFRERVGLTQTCVAVRSMNNKWISILGTPVNATRAEDKANGPAVIDTMKREIPGMDEVKAEGSKESRAAAASPTQNAGNVYLPQDAPWLKDFLDELSNFPVHGTDDQVDMTAHSINFLNALPAPIEGPLKFPQSKPVPPPTKWA